MIVLAGGNGRLGSEIRVVLEGRGQKFSTLSRADLSSAPVFQKLLEEGPFVLLDVTLAEGTETIIDALQQISPEKLKNLAGFVIGSTGHSPSQLEKISALGRKVPVTLVSNFSKGVFLFEQILTARTAGGQSVADLMRELGFDLSMWESHHTRKVDAPSGTARTLAEKAEIPLERVASTRVGQVVGEHILYVAGDAEELRIQHIAHNRRLFAVGAVDLCERIAAARPMPGLHDKAEFLLAAT